MTASCRARVEDDAILRTVRRLVHLATERSQLAYGDDSGAGMSLLTVEVMVRRLGLGLLVAPLGLNTQELAIPGYFGPPVIVVNRHGSYSMRSLALCHGVAHCLAGDADSEPDGQIRYMSSIMDYTTPAERTADLFALVNSVPGWKMETFFASGAGIASVERELRRHVAAIATAWPAARVRDRSRLRLDLYVEERP